jgi:hypothetical protein
LVNAPDLLNADRSKQGMLKTIGIAIESLIGSLILLVCIFLSTSVASPVTLPSGEIIELNQDQLERIKAQPGIFYVQHAKETIIPNKLTDRTVVDIPDTLGGGFLICTSQDIDYAFAEVSTQNTTNGPDNKASPKKQDEHPSWIKTAFSLTSGYRIDELDWNIAGNLAGRAPNILSELTWEDLQIFQVKLTNRTVIKEYVLIKSYFNYGWISDGSNQDSDYACDDRRCEFSRSNNTTADDSVWDLSVGIGPRFTFGSDFFELSPLVGYSRHQQRLITTDGFQTIPPLGSFSGLNSSYEAIWQGPWLGLDFTIRTRRPLGVFSGMAFTFSFEYHMGDFDAEADWNLRSDFAHPKSFEQQADANGYLFSFRTALYYNIHWAFLMNVTTSRWQSDPGIDRTFFADGTVADTRLNEANWQSYAFNLGICYRF